MAEELSIEHFAELARMLKYVDRHDSDEIIATMKQEGEQEAKTVEKNLNMADEIIAATTGETIDENLQSNN